MYNEETISVANHLTGATKPNLPNQSLAAISKPNPTVTKLLHEKT